MCRQVAARRCLCAVRYRAGEVIGERWWKKPQWRHRGVNCKRTNLAAGSEIPGLITTVKSVSSATMVALSAQALRPIRYVYAHWLFHFIWPPTRNKQRRYVTPASWCGPGGRARALGDLRRTSNTFGRPQIPGVADLTASPPATNNWDHPQSDVHKRPTAMPLCAIEYVNIRPLNRF